MVSRVGIVHVGEAAGRSRVAEADLGATNASAMSDGEPGGNRTAGVCETSFLLNDFATDHPLNRPKLLSSFTKTAQI
jgi:hypothetical protein